MLFTPGNTMREAGGFTLDGTPVYFRTPWTHSVTHTVGAILASSIHPVPSVFRHWEKRVTVKKCDINNGHIVYIHVHRFICRCDLAWNPPMFQQSWTWIRAWAISSVIDSTKPPLTNRPQMFRKDQKSFHTTPHHEKCCRWFDVWHLARWEMC